MGEGRRDTVRRRRKAGVLALNTGVINCFGGQERMEAEERSMCVLLGQIMFSWCVKLLPLSGTRSFKPTCAALCLSGMPG